MAGQEFIQDVFGSAVGHMHKTCGMPVHHRLHWNLVDRTTDSLHRIVIELELHKEELADGGARQGFAMVSFQQVNRSLRFRQLRGLPPCFF